MNAIQVVQLESMVLEQRRGRIDPDTEETDTHIVASQALEEQAKGSGAWTESSAIC